MSTRSYIGVQHSDGTVTAIYCHYDGYPSGVGKVLRDHYSPDLAAEDPRKKIYALLALGDISFIAPKIGWQHDFDDRKHPQRHNWVMAYGRDRGEKNTEAVKYKSVEEFLSECWEDYTYLLGENNEWQFRSGDDRLQPLTAEVIKNDSQRAVDSFSKLNQ